MMEKLKDVNLYIDSTPNLYRWKKTCEAMSQWLFLSILLYNKLQILNFLINEIYSVDIHIYYGI